MKKPGISPAFSFMISVRFVGIIIMNIGNSERADVPITDHEILRWGNCRFLINFFVFFK